MGKKACTGEQSYAPEGSVIAHRKVALYTGGQRVVHRRVAWLWQDAIAS